LKEKLATPVYKTEITAVGIRSVDHATPIYPQKLSLTSPTIGVRCSSSKGPTPCCNLIDVTIFLKWIRIWAASVNSYRHHRIIRIRIVPLLRFVIRKPFKISRKSKYQNRSRMKYFSCFLLVQILLSSLVDFY
jgi:hypothetical protein